MQSMPHYCTEFPASLPNGVAPDECVNNKSLRSRGNSVVNLRSLLAVHCTSRSWEDFRLSCSLLDLKVPAMIISKHQLKRVIPSSQQIVSRSMKHTG